MTKCKYYDCGWCYAPDEVKTNATQGGCFEPEYCHYLKSQMTEEESNHYFEVAKEIIDKYFEEKKLLKECRQTGRTTATTEKVLKTVFSQMKETDISKVLIEGEYATIMGVKYKRVEEPKTIRAQQIVDAGHRVSDGGVTLGSFIRQGKEPMSARVNYEYAAVIREVADRLCTDLGELESPIDKLRQIADEIEAL